MSFSGSHSAAIRQVNVGLKPSFSCRHHLPFSTSQFINIAKLPCISRLFRDFTGCRPAWHSPCYISFKRDAAPITQPSHHTFRRITMKALTIKDLSVSKDLGAKDMSSVRGGHGFHRMPALFASPLFSVAKSEINFDAAQSLGQSQNTLVNNGNNAAFVQGIKSDVNPTQTGKNTINFMS
jgi:hypothetical protein